MHREYAETIDISVCISTWNGIYSHDNTTRRDVIVSPIQGGRDGTEPMRSVFVGRAMVSLFGEYFKQILTKPES